MHKSSNQKNMIDVQYSNSMNAKILLEKTKNLAMTREPRKQVAMKVFSRYKNTCKCHAF